MRLVNVFRPADEPPMPPDPQDAPFSPSPTWNRPPPARRSGSAVARWLLMALALAAVLLVGAQAMRWLLVSGVPRMAAPEAAPAAPTAADTEPPLSSLPMATATTPAVSRQDAGPVQPAEPSAAPPAPVIAGAPGIHKCLVDGHTTYTNEPCAPGTDAREVLAATAADRAGESVTIAPAASPPRAVRSNAGAQDIAQCHFLSAEIARLSYEFEQPLPPPVIDHIATRLKQLQERSAEAGCGASPPTSRGKRRAVEPA